MKKIIFGLGVLVTLGMSSCQPQSSGRFEPVNRKNAIFLVDKETGEVFMMNLKIEKGKGVVGSEWKNMGSPSLAR